MTEALKEFIRRCPTAFHTVEELKTRLVQKGYRRFDPAVDPLQRGGKYYYEKNASSIFAFSVPQTAPSGFMLVATHGDSPSFKLKHTAILEKNGFSCLNTERYGGMDLHSWFDRPLGIAGRVITKVSSAFVSRTVDSRQPLCLIPSVAGHLLKDKSNPDPKCDLIPLYTQGSSKEFYPRLGVEDEVLGADLYLYCDADAVLWGEEKEFISAPRLDDLQCAFAALEGFLMAEESDCIPVLCVFDNEEVGSGTKQGAASNTLLFLLQSVMDALGMDERAKGRMLEASFALSADNAHGVHPNHPEVNDSKDRPVLNGGVVLKFNANQRYTTDGISAALVEDLCRSRNVPLQYYSNRSDLPGGSTLGNLLVRSLPVDCADVGLAQLAMHSAVETAGAKDTRYMAEFCKGFFSSALVRKDGLLQWK